MERTHTHTGRVLNVKDATTLCSHSGSLLFKPRITYQVFRENVYSPSAWYVPFVVTTGSVLLLGLLVSLIILLAKATHRCCPCKMGKTKKPL